MDRSEAINDYHFAAAIWERAGPLNSTEDSTVDEPFTPADPGVIYLTPCLVEFVDLLVPWQNYAVFPISMIFLEIFLKIPSQPKIEAGKREAGWENLNLVCATRRVGDKFV